MGTEANKVLEEISQNVVTLQSDETKEYVYHFRAALDIIINQMKLQNELFDAIYNGIFFAGSFYDGLKIDKPDEYDLNLVMKFPIDYKKIEIVNRGAKVSYIKIRANELKNMFQQRRRNPEQQYKPMESWTDKNGFLLQTKFRAWVTSVIDRAIKTLPRRSRKTYSVSRTTSGPAITLHIKVVNTSPPIELDVDLVPVIKFDIDMWPPRPFRKNPYPDIEGYSWFAVPKPSSKVAAETNDTFWRVAFPQHERKMIKDQNLLKPVIRLLKKLRDVQDIQIPSYYIKMMFLWEVKKQPESYWRETSLYTLFMDMLWMMRTYILDGKMDNYWDPREDMLSNISLQGVGERLDEIFEDILRNVETEPEILYDYLQDEDEDEEEEEDDDEDEYDDEDDDEDDDDDDDEYEDDSDDDDWESDEDVYW